MTEVLWFVAGMGAGVGAACLAIWLNDYLDRREQRRRLAEQAARIQPRDVPPTAEGFNLFLEGLRYHIEREQRQKAERDGGRA